MSSLSNVLKRDVIGVRLFLRAQRSENTMQLVLAVAVGISTGLGVWLFRQGIDFFQRLFREDFAGITLSPLFGAAAIVVVLALGGLIVGWIMNRFIGEERHHGVAGIMEAVALAGGRLRYARMPIKAFSSALSLGAGASVGPEDPSVQIGANLGSFFGQKLHLSPERVRVLVAAGGGAGIAAVFRAPIAGVFFALEVILNGEFATGSFGVVVLACVVASMVTQAIEVGGPELGALTYNLGSLAEMPLYLILGLGLAPLCVLFIRSSYWSHDTWHHYLGRIPRPLQTALTGALVGVVGIFLPQILGTGREAMIEVLSHSQAQSALGLLIVLGLVKLAMTSLSIAGGFVGGIFAPALFVGTMIGGAFGQLVGKIFTQGGVSDPRAYAIAGMAAAMAGIVRAPITAIILVFELTNDYRLILPIMLASVTCVFVAEMMEPDGMYAYGLRRKGVRLKQGRDIDVMQGLNVHDAMMTPAPTIHTEQSLLELRDSLRKFQMHGLSVVDETNQIIGIVTLSDLQKAYDSGLVEGKVADIYVKDVVTTEPDEPLWTAIRKMGQRDIGRLPVIDPNTREPIGVLTRNSIMRAYNQAITRKIEEQHTEEQVRLHTLTGAHVVDLLVRPGAQVVGKKVKDVQWPPESAIAAIRRGERLIVPHGGTEIRLWDTMTIVADPECQHVLEQLTGQPVRQH
jgi:chloride channel protein, CIC family